MAAGGRTDDGSVRERPPGRCLSEGGGARERVGKSRSEAKMKWRARSLPGARDRGSQSIRREVHAPPILLIAVTMRDREVLSLWLRTEMPITVPDYPRIHKHCPCPTIKKIHPFFLHVESCARTGDFLPELFWIVLFFDPVILSNE